ncbi:MAG: divB, partial [Phenylobacterium sp.]|nr:divB [Phenylobacterium sp.]
MLGVAALLIGIGVALSFASSPAAAMRMNIGDPFHFAVRQCVFGVGASVVLLCVSMLEVRTIRRAAFFIWLVAIAVMIALPLVGHNAKGATRWLEVGGFTLQPSEFMKPALVVLVAWMFAEGQKGQGVPGVSI